MDNSRRRGSLIGGAILILAGLLALLGQLFQGYNFWGALWPLIIIGFGILFFVGMLVGGKPVAGLAVPGSIITIIGLMLLLQNLTGYWESWSYSWTVIIIAVGVGIFIMGAWTGNEHSRRAGLRVMETGLVLLIIFGAFFEMIFSIGQPVGLRQMLFPAALILLGIYLVLVRSGLLRSRSKDAADQPESRSQEQ